MWLSLRRIRAARSVVVRDGVAAADPDAPVDPAWLDAVCPHEEEVSQAAYEAHSAQNLAEVMARIWGR
jgi:hypothetical protein